MQPTTPDTAPEPAAPSDFIRDIVAEDLQTANMAAGWSPAFRPSRTAICTSAMPKSICLNFGIAARISAASATCASTTPTRPRKMSSMSIRSRKTCAGSASTGQDSMFYASDYFEQLYDYAVQLIKDGQSLCLRPDAPRRCASIAARSTDRARTALSQPLRRGKSRPVRAHEGRRVSRRRAHAAGEDRHGFAEHQHARPGALPHPARASIIAPATSGASTRCTILRTACRDSIEGITHSICTLEFEVHRPLYDWILDKLTAPSHPQQIEFARLNLSYTVMSKRKLLQLVKEKLVTGWDDPRMPTISGLRRRGVHAGGHARFLPTHRRDQIQRPDRYRVARTRHSRGPEQARAARRWRSCGR